MLPMGWNWSLFFCQAAVEAKILTGSVENADLVHGWQVVQSVELSPVVATCVDKLRLLANINSE